jgi:hypothetical protein
VSPWTRCTILWCAPAAAALDALDAAHPDEVDRLLPLLTRYALRGDGEVLPLADRPGQCLHAGNWRVLFTRDADKQELLVHAIGPRADA